LIDIMVPAKPIARLAEVPRSAMMVTFLSRKQAVARTHYQGLAPVKPHREKFSKMAF